MDVWNDSFFCIEKGYKILSIFSFVNALLPPRFATKITMKNTTIFLLALALFSTASCDCDP